MPNKNSIKNRCITNAEPIWMMGNNETLNTIFFTKKLFESIELAALCKLSEKKNHGTIPAISQRIKGKLSTGTALNPTWNINQNINIIIVGCINAHKIPR